MLPWSEKLAFAANWVARKALGAARVAPYVPDFTQAFDHFCLHAGQWAWLPCLAIGWLLGCGASCCQQEQQRQRQLGGTSRAARMGA